jgi:RAD50-interacting protein 1
LAFDAALVEEGFIMSGTTASKNLKAGEPTVITGDLENLAGVSAEILGRKEVFEAWLAGEKECGCNVLLIHAVPLNDPLPSHGLETPVAETQYHEIISDPKAWVIADDDEGAELFADKDFKTTNSARRIKALVEQVTGEQQPYGGSLEI